jgi:hypothetical protein
MPIPLPIPAPPPAAGDLLGQRLTKTMIAESER